MSSLGTHKFSCFSVYHSIMVFKDGLAAFSGDRQCIRRDNGHRSLLVAPALLLVATSTGSVTIHHWAVPALPPPPPTSPGLRLILHPRHQRCRPLHLSSAHLGGCTKPHLSSKGKACFSFLFLALHYAYLSQSCMPPVSCCLLHTALAVLSYPEKMRISDLDGLLH